jgi:hypothetical protein
VAVPETAMDQDDSAVAGKNEIGATRQVPAMQSEAKAAGVQTVAQRHLRLCVPAADAAHIEPPLVGCQDVDHRASGSIAGVCSLNDLCDFLHPKGG